MKARMIAQSCFLLCLLALGHANEVQQNEARTIAQVVDLLQNMMDKSAEETRAAEEEYSKFKCYCDTNKEEKTASVAAAKEQIEMLSSSIDRLKGSNEELSQESVSIKAEMDANAQAREAAQAIRDRESQLFSQTEQELSAAISQMTQAVQMLEGISHGADQSLAQDSSRTAFRASRAAITKVTADVKEALLAASAYMKAQDRAKVESFLQQSTIADGNGITSVLRKVLTTFEENLASAQQNERTAAAEHTALVGTKTRTFNSLKVSYDSKQSLLSSTDSELAAKRSQLDSSQAQESDDSTFLANLETECSGRGKEWDDQKMFRANEEAAMAKAIAILTSQEAYSSFSKVSATLSLSGKKSKVSLLQRSVSSREQLEQTIWAEAREHKSTKLSHIAVMLRDGNPFAKVFAEIDTMISALDREAAQDEQQRDWCASEKSANSAALSEREHEVSNLNTQVLDISNTIDGVEDGLKALIRSNEDSLDGVRRDQVDQASFRKSAEAAYTQKLKEVAEAKEVLNKAIEVLTSFYNSQPSLPAMLQKDGQKSKSNQVIEMLNFILGEAEKEGAQATEDEESAKANFETSITSLQTQEADITRTLAELRESLANKEKELQSANQDLRVTERGRVTLQNYIASIEPGCNFIETNFDLRASNRADEKAALEAAKRQIEASPANAAYVANSQ